MTTVETRQPARYEFRVWGDLLDIRTRLEQIGHYQGSGKVQDRYLLGPRWSISAKLRNETLKVKELLDVRAGFQRWRPAWSQPAPFPAHTIQRLFTELGVEAGGLPAEPVSEPELTMTVREQHNATAILATKWRHRYHIDQVRAEATQILIEGGDEAVWCVAIEDPDLERLMSTRADLGIDAGAPNISVNVAVGGG